MNRFVVSSVLCSLGFCHSLSLAVQDVARSSAKKPYFFAESALDFNSVLKPPPTAGSTEERRDEETVIRLEAERTPAEITAAQFDDKEEDMFVFRDVIGPTFTPENFPLTKEFSAHLKHDSEVVDPPLKHLFHRPRPYQADSQLRPVCKLSSEPSYPSGHAMLGYLFGYVLAQIVPERRDAILKRADLYAYHRLVCGVHFPSDLEASRIASSVLFGLISTNADYQKELRAVSKEISEGLAHK